MVREFRGLLKEEAETAGAVNGGADGSKADTDGALPLRAAKKKGKGEASLAETVERIVKGSGLLEYHRGQDEVAGTQKAANLDELVNAASLYPNSLEGLTDFLETIELDRTLSSGEETADAVTLITMHNTKGLEFPVVIVTGLEQGLFPREDDSGEELEEQRRLFYVAITRAKDELYLSACHYRRLHGRLFETLPSRFLTEIDSELITAERSTGASKSAAAQRGYSGGYSSGYGPRPAAAAQGATSATSTNSSKYGDSPWRAGQAVYHEDYGSGFITQVKPTPNSGPLVIVRFETGKMAQFFVKFTTKLEVQKS
jgi:DNA helicase-2/ATP-dependent DNA helicase PcrA